jgi:4'-phosphopantetheinyl transferase EntD
MSGTDSGYLDAGAGMLARLVPRVVATAEARSRRDTAQLLPEEEQAVSGATDRRRREFASGRACARLALARLGVQAAPIPSGPNREPLWPAGVVGSITHCDGYRASAVASVEHVLSIGIDAEPHAPLPDDVVEQVAFGPELAMVASGGDLHLDRVLFCVKEAVYKAWFPLARTWLGFEDATVSIEIPTASFCARLLVSGPVVGGVALTELPGRWCVEGELICTAVVLLR